MDIKDKLDEEIDLKDIYKTIKKETASFFNFKYVYELLLIPIVYLTLWLRTRNLPLLRDKYLIGLDPYYFYRLAQYIIEHGKLLTFDTMRVFPFGLSKGFDFFPYFLAYWNKFLNIFGNFSLIYTTLIYTAAVTTVSIIFFYLFVKNVANKKVALLASLILVVMPAYLFRTIAGFSDHEALFMFFTFLSLWLFSEAELRKKLILKLSFAVAAGLTTFMAATTWSGIAILTVPIAGLIFMKIIWDKSNTKNLVTYTLWLLSYLGPLAFFRSFGSLHDISAIVPIFAVLSFGASSLVTKFKIKKSQQIKLLLPFVILIGFAISLLLRINYKSLLSTALRPAENSGRVADTISEIIGGTAIFQTFSWFSVLALLGAGLAAYYAFDSENKKTKIILSSATLITGGFILFKSFSTTVNLLILGAFTIIFFSQVWKRNLHQPDKQLLILMVISFLFTAYLTTTATRFLFVFSPPAAIFSAYIVFKGVEITPKRYKILTIIGAVLVISALLYNDFGATYNQAKRTGSSLPGQWESSMLWLKDNTPAGSAVAHWWDYGYWTQSVGERPSIADGGTHGEYMLYLLGRYGMTAQTSEEALTYFNTHNISYLLYSREEIGKYWAFSHIGSNKDLDRESTIGIFGLSNIKEVRDGNLMTYSGNWGLDRDIIIDGKVFKKGTAIIKKAEVMDDQSGGRLFISDGGKTIEQPIKCLVYGGKKIVYDIDTNVGGCFVFMPAFDSSGKGQPNGAAFYLSDKVVNGLFARLYIMNETVNGFELVYSDNIPLGTYKNRLVGPIKIWKINYPSDIGINPLWRSDSAEHEEGYR